MTPPALGGPCGRESPRLVERDAVQDHLRGVCWEDGSAVHPRGDGSGERVEKLMLET